MSLPAVVSKGLRLLAARASAELLIMYNAYSFAFSLPRPGRSLYC